MEVFMRYGVIGVFFVLGCTKANPAVCCLDPVDCKEVGISEDSRLCPGNFACVDHECVVATCSKQGCEAAAPVCNVVTDVCESCATNDDCTRFADTKLCNATNGACVQCLMSSDCSGTTPVCAGNACRACALDKECPSGACGDDGACVPESNIAYLDPGGTDIGTCSRSAPCRTITYGVSKLAGARNHVVMAFGSYVELARVEPASTSATSVVIHGGFASVSAPLGADNATVTLMLATSVKELKIFGGRPVVTNAVDIAGGDNGAYSFEACTIDSGGVGVSTNSKLTLLDTTLVGDGPYALLLFSTARLIIDRVTIKGRWMTGISSSSSGSTVDITNLLAYGTTDRAIDLPQTNGMITFSTIADSGTDAGTGPRAVLCAPGLTVRSSIIWAPGTTSRDPIGGCNLSNTIAGPTAVIGATNTNPQFVDPGDQNYHIGSNSPARNAVETGPVLDFERDPRPRGTKFDIGADEGE